MDKHGRGAEHCQATVLELTQLHFFLFGGVGIETKLILQVKGVPPKVTRDSLAVLEERGSLDSGQRKENLEYCLWAFAVELSDGSVAQGAVEGEVGGYGGK